jgi:membrane-anchored protein YejM (alkaline phosphatase superfamily)
MMSISYRPILDPLPLHGDWESIALLVPLVIAIVLVYKSIRLPRMKLRWMVRETVRLSAFILFMMALAAGVIFGVASVL